LLTALVVGLSESFLLSESWFPQSSV